MEASERPEREDLSLQLSRLECEEAEIEDRLSKLLGRNEVVGDAVRERRISALTTEHVGVRRAINAIRARMAPIMRIP